MVLCWIGIAEYDAAAPFTDQDVLSQPSGLDTQGISALLFLKQAPYIITDNKHATEVICSRQMMFAKIMGQHCLNAGQRPWLVARNVSS